MRKTERERDAAFAWQVFRDAVYATLSLATTDGKPYAVPVNAVTDGKAFYFHCGKEGEKMDILKQNPAVCLSAVSYAAIVPEQLTTLYRSAVVKGNAQIVTDNAEKAYALRLITEFYAPEQVAMLDTQGSCAQRAQIVKIVPAEITGKEKESD